MCELFGFSADREMNVNPWLEDFFAHSTEHPHGWGLATFHRGVPSIEKEPVRAIDSSYLKSRLESAVRGTDVMAHIRYATVGKLNYYNTHPFVKCDMTGRCWTFEHNGTVLKSRKLIDRYRAVEDGTTDSERILFYIISKINKKTEKTGRPLNDLERFGVIDAAVAKLSDGNKLNLIINDGEYLYVHTNHKKNMHVFNGQGYKVFATSPLEHALAEAEGAEGGEWQPFKLCQLLVYRGGKQVFAGTEHGHLHRFTEKEIDLLRQSVAEAVGEKKTNS